MQKDAGPYGAVGYESREALDLQKARNRLARLEGGGQQVGPDPFAAEAAAMAPRANPITETLFGVPRPTLTPEQEAHRAWLQQQSAALSAQRQDIDTRERIGSYLNPDAVNTRDRPLNYLGTSAGGQRTIERIADPERLNEQASGLSGFDQMTQAAIGQQGAAADIRGANLQTAAQALQGAQDWGQLGLESRNTMFGRLTDPGTSAAEMQLRQGQARAAENAIAMARSGRGYGGGGGAMRAAQFSAAEGMGAVNQQAAALRAQEEATRTAQLGQLAALDQSAQANYAGQGAAFRGQALGALGAEGQALGQQGQLATQQTGAQANAQTVNAANALQRNKFNADYANYEAPNTTAQDIGAASSALGAGFAAATTLFSDIRGKTNIQPLDGSFGSPSMGGGQFGGFGGMDTSFGLGNGIIQQAMAGPSRNLGQAAGMAGYQAGALSDERSKQKIRELQAANDALSSAFGSAASESPEGAEMYGRAAEIAGQPRRAADRFAAVPSYSYEYKDPTMPGAAPGEQVGPMAQDLAKVLPSAVGRSPETGMLSVDPDRVALANASATGEIARDLERVKRETEEQRRILQALRPAMGRAN